MVTAACGNSGGSEPRATSTESAIALPAWTHTPPRAPPTPKSSRTELVSFLDVELDAPLGALASRADAAPPPAPGVPSKELRSISEMVLSHPGFLIQVTRLSSPLQAGDAKASVRSRAGGGVPPKLTVQATPGGFRLEYEDRGARVTERYLRVGRDQYKCQYESTSSKDTGMAEAVCSSMRGIPEALDR